MEVRIVSSKVFDSLAPPADKLHEPLEVLNSIIRKRYFKASKKCKDEKQTVYT